MCTRDWRLGSAACIIGLKLRGCFQLSYVFVHHWIVHGPYQTGGVSEWSFLFEIRSLEAWLSFKMCASQNSSQNFLAGFLDDGAVRSTPRETGDSPESLLAQSFQMQLSQGCGPRSRSQLSKGFDFWATLHWVPTCQLIPWKESFSNYGLGVCFNIDALPQKPFQGPQQVAWCLLQLNGVICSHRIVRFYQNCKTWYRRQQFIINMWRCLAQNTYFGWKVEDVSHKTHIFGEKWRMYCTKHLLLTKTGRCLTQNTYFC